MTHMYERGQIVVPKYFRELLGWGADTPIAFSVENNRLIVERRIPIDKELEAFARQCKANLGGKADFDGEYDMAMRKKFRKMGLRY